MNRVLRGTRPLGALVSGALAVGAAALLLAAASPAEAAEILFVADTAGADSNIPAALRADGHNVTIVDGDFAQGNAALRGDLSSFGAVYWSASGTGAGNTHDDPGVFENLSTYVIAGGRVFVTGYDSVASPSDPLLIQFLGASGSRDVPPAPSAITSDQNSLTTGVIDIRGRTPQNFYSDRDGLTGLSGDTVAVVMSDGRDDAQWTLRRLGQGEIAYVSNGQSGANAHPSWVTVADGGAGVYSAALRNFAAAAGTPAMLPVHLRRRAAPPPPPQHARGARVLFIQQELVAVAVSDREVWAPGTFVGAPLSICLRGNACQPVLEQQSCSPPQCPGSGVLLRAANSFGSVEGFPTDREGWDREVASLRADPRLAALPYGSHPDAHRGPLRFNSNDREGPGWELGLRTAIGGMGRVRGTFVGGGVSIGFRFNADHHDARDDRETELNILVGDSVGLDLRAWAFANDDGRQATSWMAAVGLALTSVNAIDGDRFRVPTVAGILLPELGAAFRPDRDAAFYAGWHLPFSFLLEDALAIEARGSLMVFTDWVRSGEPEVMGLFTFGVVFL